MNRALKSIFIFGIYSFLMGFVLLFLPEVILPIVGLPVSTEPWLFLLGFVLICSSYYYVKSALHQNMDFARLTTHTRFVAPLVVTYLVLTKKADWHFVSFGLIDGLAGLWTWIELKKIKSN
jgi:hypothetical protein